jgi:N-acetylmuramoyl-L-alanine amidase
VLSAAFPLVNVAQRMGMQVQETEDRVRIYSEWTQLEFKLHRREFKMNGVQVFLGEPVIKGQKGLYVSDLDVTKTLRPLLTPQIFKPAPKLRRILIDPGHGGKDPGAENDRLGYNEKTATLDLARRLKKILEAQGYQVALTRNDDTFISLTRRSEMAVNLKADLFISLHFNSAVASVSGIETFVFTPQNQPSTSRSTLHRSDAILSPGNRFDAWNLILGYSIQRSLSNGLKSPDRGVRRARFMVLKNLECPGVLVEGGFISNTNEGKNIGSGRYREKMAESIASGVTFYHKTLKRVDPDS